MKGLLLQYDDRNPSWASKLIERNKIASKYLEWDHIYLTESEFDDTIAPYWRKVFLVDKYLKLNIYSYIVWIDSDAVLINESELVNFIKNEMLDFSFAFSSNPGILRIESFLFRLWAAPFCAGVFIVKNTNSSLKIMDEWKSHYDSSLWTKTLDQSNSLNILNIKNTYKWKGVGIYGGLSYEQGCFEVYIFRSHVYRKHLLQCDHTRMNYLPIKNEKCTFKTIFLHYWNGNRKRIYKDWGGNLEYYKDV
jgi:hypothetical protein